MDDNSDLADLVVTGIPRSLRGYLDSRVTGDSCDHLDIQPGHWPTLGQRLSQGALRRNRRGHWPARPHGSDTVRGKRRKAVATILPVHIFSGNEIKERVQTRVNL